MKDGCFDVEQIASVLELPADDARRRHLESCPRCRNLARLYVAFMKARPVDGARPEEAREHLAQVILQAAGRADAPESTRQTSPSRKTVSRRDAGARWWPLWRLRPAGLLAAAAVITLVAVVLWQDHPTAPPVLRDDRAPRPGTLSLRPAETVEGGGVRLTWTRDRGAERYEVRVYDAELDEVYRHPAVPDTTLVLRLSDIPAPSGSPGFVWRVHAFHGDDVVAVSPPWIFSDFVVAACDFLIVRSSHLPWAAEPAV